MPSSAVRTAPPRLGVGALGVALLALVLGPVALVVHASWGPLERADAAVTDAAERAVAASPALLAAARGVTLLGDPVLMTVLSVVLAVALLLSGALRLAAFVVVARLGAQLLSTGTKAAVDRVRPVFDEPVAMALGASYPSGHALGSSAFYLAAAVVALPLLATRRRWLALAVALPLAVAASRVLLGVHYATDVVAGLLLGAGWVAVCTAVLLPDRLRP